MSAPVTPSKARLSVVFSQDDRSRQGRTIERLIGLLGTMRSIDLQLVIVDNAAPGDWVHEISDSIVQLGGSSPFADLAAFDRGVAFLESVGRPTDLYLFMTDRFLNSPQFLHDAELEGVRLEESTIATCLELETCIGWIDHFDTELSFLGYFYSKGLSTRFLLVSKTWLPSLRPFDVLLEPQHLFSSRPGLLFSDSAPLSPELRENVLASLATTREEHETVVSRQQRAFGLLKEHLFSAKLQEKEIPCYDLRLLKGHTAATLAEANLSAWPWMSGSGSAEAPTPQFHLEVCEVPKRFHHGDAAQLQLTGWVLSHPQAQAVRVELSDQESLVEPCDIARPDVLEAFADDFRAHGVEAEELCGFKIEKDLGFLKPGRYQARFVVPGTSISAEIGSFQVLQLPTEESEAVESSGSLSLGAPSPMLSLRTVGAYQPKTGTVPVHLKGVVSIEDPQSSLVFLQDGEAVLEEPVSKWPMRQAQVWFELQREVKVTSPGPWELALVLKRQDSEALHTLACWRQPVMTVEPEVNLEYLDFRVQSLEQCIVGIAGWVRHHFVVEELILQIGEEAVELALDRLRPDVAEHLGDTLVKKQGFHGDFCLDLGPGEYPAEIRGSWQGQRETLWQDTVTLETPTGPEVLVNCERLADLVEGRVAAFWSSINFEGSLKSRYDDLSVALWVDGVEVDRQEVESGERFELRHTPQRPGCYPLRLVVEADGRELYDSGPLLATFEDFQMPEETVSAIERFIERFELEPLLGDMEPEDLARATLGSDRELKADYLEMLNDIDEALESAGRPGDEVELTPVDDAGVVESFSFQRRAPLKVLFVSWEVPYPRHGGGVWLTQLLQTLRDRHEITLVHSYGLDEEDWLDEVRDSAPRVISIPRLSKAKTQPADSRMVRHIYEDYLPTLHSAIEMEVETGNYDIVNYDYSKLYPHATSIDIPQIMVVHEERFSTSLAKWSQDQASRLAPASQMDQMLREFYFSALKMPRKFSHLAALTEEDAYMLQAFQSSSKVYVNHIGVDVDQLGRPVDLEEEDKTLVFLGNYRHPPNVAAAKFFAEEVMPEVRQRHSDARFLMIGSHAPKELKACENEAVSVTGFVDDFRPYLWRAAAFVAPIFLGAGMRVKILEAMACGVPIIGTQRSMHGIGAIDGRQYFRAETASQFVELSCRCLESREETLEIGRQGADLIADKHSYQMSAREREGIWYQVIEDSKIRHK